MNNTIMLTICSLFYSLILLLNVVKKSFLEIKNQEKKILKYLVITNFLAIIVEIGCWFFANNFGTESIYTIIITRIFLVLLAIWVSLLTLYISEISIKRDSSFKKLVKKLIIILMVLFIVLEIFLPMNLRVNPTYASGMATQTIFYFSEFYIALSFFLMIKNGKYINLKKYSPLFIYLAGGILAMIVQSIRPDWLLANSIDTFVTFLIFLNIENNSNQLVDNSKKVEK